MRYPSLSDFFSGVQTGQKINDRRNKRLAAIANAPYEAEKRKRAKQKFEADIAKTKAETLKIKADTLKSKQNTNLMKSQASNYNAAANKTKANTQDTYLKMAATLATMGAVKGAQEYSLKAGLLKPGQVFKQEGDVLNVIDPQTNQVVDSMPLHQISLIAGLGDANKIKKVHKYFNTINTLVNSYRKEVNPKANAQTQLIASVMGKDISKAKANVNAPKITQQYKAKIKALIAENPEDALKIVASLITFGEPELVPDEFKHLVATPKQEQQSNIDPAQFDINQ